MGLVELVAHAVVPLDKGDSELSRLEVLPLLDHVLAVLNGLDVRGNRGVCSYFVLVHLRRALVSLLS